MKPSLGRIVFTRVDPLMNNGADIAPAVITRVWSDTLVNIRVMLDSENPPLWKTSVLLFDSEEDAKGNDAEGITATHACWWPPKVGS